MYLYIMVKVFQLFEMEMVDHSKHYERFTKRTQTQKRTSTKYEQFIHLVIMLLPFRFPTRNLGENYVGRLTILFCIILTYLLTLSHLE